MHERLRNARHKARQIPIQDIRHTTLHFGVPPCSLMLESRNLTAAETLLSPSAPDKKKRDLYLPRQIDDKSKVITSPHISQRFPLGSAMYHHPLNRASPLFCASHHRYLFAIFGLPEKGQKAEITGMQAYCLQTLMPRTSARNDAGLSSLNDARIHDPCASR